MNDMHFVGLTIRPLSDISWFLKRSGIITGVVSSKFANMVSGNGENGQSEALRTLLPYFAYGKVVHGFGRGSRELGCPTANVSDQVVSEFPEALPCGVYFGFANVDNGPVYRMVTSVGWNPQFNNEKKSIETYIMHDFGKDFYGSLLKVIMLGYLRPMHTFPNLDALKDAIRSDIENAEKRLEDAAFQSFKSHAFFSAGGEANIPNARKIADIIPDPKPSGGSGNNDPKSVT